MKNDLDEQIKYMESEVEWYTGKYSSGREGWKSTLDSCKAILGTLKRMKEIQDKQKAFHDKRKYQTRII